MRALALSLLLLAWAGAAAAGPADVVKATAVQESSGTWRFEVTVRHDDAGWDHYADQWDVVSARDGAILGTRVLLHPHDNEQPFTRSLNGVAIPEGVNRVILRARDSKHGWGGAELTLELPRRE